MTQSTSDWIDAAEQRGSFTAQELTDAEAYAQAIGSELESFVTAVKANDFQAARDIAGGQHSLHGHWIQVQFPE